MQTDDIGCRQMETILSQVVVFFESSKSISFMWILDAVTAVLASVSNVRYDKRNVELVSPAVRCFVDGIQACWSAQMTGVDLAANPRIRRSLELHGVTEASRFWWTCGCGAENPSAAFNCFVAPRNGSRTYWTCKQCSTSNRTKGLRLAPALVALHQDYLRHEHGVECCRPMLSETRWSLFEL